MRGVHKVQLIVPIFLGAAHVGDDGMKMTGKLPLYLTLYGVP